VSTGHTDKRRDENDGRQTVKLRFPLNVASTIVNRFERKLQISADSGPNVASDDRRQTSMVYHVNCEQRGYFTAWRQTDHSATPYIYDMIYN